MRKMRNLKHRFVMGGLALALVVALFGRVFSMTSFVSHAESQGRITAQSVNIGKNPVPPAKGVAVQR